MNFQCTRCCHCFKDSEAHARTVWLDEPTTDWDRSPIAHTLFGCPECRSEELTEIAPCAECGEAPAEKGNDLCTKCLAIEDEAEGQFWLDEKAEPHFWRHAS